MFLDMQGCHESSSGGGAQRFLSQQPEIEKDHLPLHVCQMKFLPFERLNGPIVVHRHVFGKGRRVKIACHPFFPPSGKPLIQRSTPDSPGQKRQHHSHKKTQEKLAITTQPPAQPGNDLPVALHHSFKKSFFFFFLLLKTLFLSLLKLVCAHSS